MPWSFMRPLADRRIYCCTSQPSLCCAGLHRPTVEDWQEVNAQVPRLVDALPNGPVGHPTVRVYLAGGVPEVMLHFALLGLLRLDVLTVTGKNCEVLTHGRLLIEGNGYGNG